MPHHSTVGMTQQHRLAVEESAVTSHLNRLGTKVKYINTGSLSQGIIFQQNAYDLTCKNKDLQTVHCVNDRKVCLIPLFAGRTVWRAFPAGHELTDTGPVQTHRWTGPLEHSEKKNNNLNHFS